MIRRLTAFETSGANPHRRPRAQPELRLATPVPDRPSGLLPTLEELLQAVEHDPDWQSGQLLKDCEADTFD